MPGLAARCRSHISSVGANNVPPAYSPGHDFLRFRSIADALLGALMMKRGNSGSSRQGAVAGSVDRLLVTIHAVTLPGKDLGLPFGPAQLAWLHARPSQSAFLGSNAGDGLGGREEIGLQLRSQERLQDLGRLGTQEDHAAVPAPRRFT